MIFLANPAIFFKTAFFDLPPLVSMSVTIILLDSVSRATCFHCWNGLYLFVLQCFFGYVFDVVFFDLITLFTVHPAVLRASIVDYLDFVYLLDIENHI